ncbi:hypothetical protein C2845_PM01G46470 [Panicum miliaceum]|uniref:Uncharacterized protein n=1 Tax=Panicum miliaceum TaxID=4540 RepID=A0A3L6TTB6_PANMI|nr:hypothetical protein C2845_PM01G46470 [Panicum miliaceum]
MRPPLEERRASAPASRAAGEGPSPSKRSSGRPSGSCGLAPSAMCPSLQEERRASGLAPASGAPGAGRSPSGSREQEAVLPAMDASSSYLLKIRIIGNSKKVKKDITCFVFEKVVDSDTVNFKDFIESIVDKFPPGYQEVVHVHNENKVVDMAITYTDPLEPYIPLTEWPGGTKEDSDYGSKPKQKQKKGPPKKRTKKTTMAATETSIVPFDDAPAPCMSFPPSQNSEVSAKKKGKGDTSSSGKSVRSMSRCGSNQHETLPIEYPMVLSNSRQQTKRHQPKLEGRKELQGRRRYKRQRI